MQVERTIYQSNLRVVSGVRVSNRWVTYLVHRDSVSSFDYFPKGAVIPDDIKSR